MNLQMLMIGVLLVVVFIGFLSFAYSAYGMYYSTATATTGAALISSHQMHYIIQLITYLVSFGVGATMFYTRKR